MSRSLAIRLAITVVLLAAVVWRVNPARVAVQVRDADWLQIFYALLLTPLAVWFKIIRWRLLARTVVPDISMGTATKSYLSGLSLAFVTPSSSGELARGLFVPGDKKVELTSIVFLDKLLDVSAVTICAGVGLTWLPWAWAKLLGVALLIMVPAGWLAFPGLFPAISSRLPFLQKSSLANRVVRSIGMVNRRLIFVCLVIGVGGFLVSYAQMFVVVAAFVPECPWRASGLFPIITLGRILPSVGGFGPREWVAAILLPQYGIPAAAASAAVFMQAVVVMLLPALIGALFLLKSPSRKREQ